MGSLVDQLSHKLATLGFPTQTRSRLGFQLLPSDPVVDFFRHLGYGVVEYDTEPYPVQTLLVVGAKMFAFMGASSLLTYLLYHYVATRGFVARYGCVGLVGALLLYWPMMEERSGAMLADFWKPALGFRSALLLWDIFHIRPRAEVERWSLPRFFCQLWTFPREDEEIEERARVEGFRRSARWENAKGLPKVTIEGLLLGLTLYFVPPYEYTRGMSRLAYHCYCDALGLSILMALALFGDGLLKTIGIFCNVEMADMFENPLGTINIRLFWSHWNRAIATVLHRVVFGGGRSTRSSKIGVTRRVKEGKHAHANGSAVNGSAHRALEKRRPHLDNLSETEAEHRTDDEDDGSASPARRSRAAGLKPMTKLPPKDSSDAAATTTKTPKPPTRSSSKPRSPFFPKAVAAVVTFAISGIFHEHITYNTLGIADGKNFLFFVLNGFATVASTWFKRSLPHVNERIPTWLAVLMLHAFIMAVIPLFCSPFIKSDFFVQMIALRYELLPIVARKRGVWVQLFGT